MIGDADPDLSRLLRDVGEAATARKWRDAIKFLTGGWVPKESTLTGTEMRQLDGAFGYGDYKRPEFFTEAEAQNVLTAMGWEREP
jgi:hypothetical protein